ncbi:MAG TPA: hypothetical protein VF293_07205, partial [Candidatus Limnocylindrales bacterium]
NDQLLTERAPNLHERLHRRLVLATLEPTLMSNPGCPLSRATSGRARSDSYDHYSPGFRFSVHESRQVAALSPADSQVPAVHPALEESSARTV